MLYLAAYAAMVALACWIGVAAAPVAAGAAQRCQRRLAARCGTVPPVPGSGATGRVWRRWRVARGHGCRGYIQVLGGLTSARRNERQRPKGGGAAAGRAAQRASRRAVRPLQMPGRMTVRIAIVAGLCAPFLAGADWYQWRDASGTVHVTNQVAVPRATPQPASAPPPAQAPVAAAGAPSEDPAAADPQSGRRARLEENRAHLALLRASGRTDPAALAMENELQDAIRADAEALR